MAFLWSVWVLHGELGGALGESGASLGRLLVVPGGLLEPLGRAKVVFGRHLGSPQDVLGSPEGEKVYSRACGHRFWLHLVAFLCVMVACFAGWAWAERGLGADKVQ